MRLLISPCSAPSFGIGTTLHREVRNVRFRLLHRPRDELIRLIRGRSVVLVLMLVIPVMMVVSGSAAGA